MDRGVGGETEPEDRDGDEESTNNRRVEALGKKESVVVSCRNQRGRRTEKGTYELGGGLPGRVGRRLLDVGGVEVEGVETSGYDSADKEREEHQAFLERREAVALLENDWHRDKVPEQGSGRRSAPRTTQRESEKGTCR